MRRFKLAESGDRGWFIGDFDKAVFKTTDFEVCYQFNPRTQTPTHYHANITEITLLVSGKVVVNGQLMLPGDIYIIDPSEISQVEYLEDSNVITTKTPSDPKDKYLL